MKQFKNIRKLLDYINFESDLDDFDKIHQTIENELIFKGTNLWILVFAIIVASVGLNMNSTAVIIGAMLISPLMGPINGMGYGIATYNLDLFRSAVKNFTFAVLASLIASTAYFAMSPISTAHSELLARTSPTIYDVLIALFGGLAGIVAISSKHKGNVIPGVAIATALMPPLCTAGYGLATGQLNYFFGALYLFTINTVFIALSSVAISQILEFPIRATIEEASKKKINSIISTVILLVLIPSIYFGYNLVQKEKFVENASKYIRNVRVVEGNYLLKDEINPNTKTIVLIYGGSNLSELQKNEIIRRANDFSLEDAKIEFHQGFSFEDLTQEKDEVNKLKSELNRMSLLLKLKDNQIDSLDRKKYLGKQVLEEVKILYPEIINSSYAETYMFSDDSLKFKKVKLVVFKTNGKEIKKTDKEKINSWLSTRLSSDNLKVYFDIEK